MQLNARYVHRNGCAPVERSYRPPCCRLCLICIPRFWIRGLLEDSFLPGSLPQPRHNTPKTPDASMGCAPSAPCRSGNFCGSGVAAHSSFLHRPGSSTALRRHHPLVTDWCQSLGWPLFNSRHSRQKDRRYRRKWNLDVLLAALHDTTSRNWHRALNPPVSLTSLLTDITFIYHHNLHHVFSLSPSLLQVWQRWPLRRGLLLC